MRRRRRPFSSAPAAVQRRPALSTQQSVSLSVSQSVEYPQQLRLCFARHTWSAALIGFLKQLNVLSLNAGTRLVERFRVCSTAPRPTLCGVPSIEMIPARPYADTRPLWELSHARSARGRHVLDAASAAAASATAAQWVPAGHAIECKCKWPLWEIVQGSRKLGVAPPVVESSEG